MKATLHYETLKTLTKVTSPYARQPLIRMAKIHYKFTSHHNNHQGQSTKNKIILQMTLQVIV